MFPSPHIFLAQTEFIIYLDVWAVSAAFLGTYHAVSSLSSLWYATRKRHTHAVILAIFEMDPALLFLGFLALLDLVVSKAVAALVTYLGAVVARAQGRLGGGHSDRGEGHDSMDLCDESHLRDVISCLRK